MRTLLQLTLVSLLLASCNGQDDDDSNITYSYDCVLGECQTAYTNGTYASLQECEADCERRDAKLIVYLGEYCQWCEGGITVHNPHYGDSYSMSSYFNFAPDCGNEAAATFDVRSGQVEVFVECLLNQWLENVTVQPNTCTKVRLKCDGSISVSSVPLPAGGGGDNCIVGTWTRQVCGGSVTATYVFNSSGSGSFSDVDCTGQCTRYIPFTWTDSGSSIAFTYQQGTICGNPVTPNGDVLTYTCSGNSLVLAGNSYSRQ